MAASVCEEGGFLAFQTMYPSLCENKTSSYRCAGLTSLSQPCLPVSNVGPTRILPFLYLGSQQDALSKDITQTKCGRQMDAAWSTVWRESPVPRLSPSHIL
ncbi:DUS16-like protein [Mya arenaria]|uniref:DUS16-like protein n=1 Tax=Mya arenaria TaxID=6604 RepID=A0ABY7EHQ4_MYAAR|nr:DUS16-like protein [Mya arenaria]